MRMVNYAFCLLIIAFLNSSAQVVSTAAGGNWGNSLTWVGGVIPNENSDVVINGPVEAISATVNNLTVNAAGTLQDECCAGRNIYVKGNLTNYGLIKNAYGGFWLYVQGAVNNHGTMTQTGLVFNGAGDQILNSDHIISVKEMWKSPDGQIIANSNVIIDSVTRVWLDNDILNMGTYKLTKLPSWSIDNWFTGGVIYSNGEIDISGISVMHSDLDGNFTLVGSKVMEFGTITVHHDMHVGPGKIIQDECCAGRTIYIKGNLLNEGIIRNGYGGLKIAIQGNVINNGKMEQNALHFSGAKTQYISGTKKFSIHDMWKDPNGQIAAASDIVIDSLCRVYLDGDTLNMGYYKLTKLPCWTTDYWFSAGVIYSNGDIDVSGISVMRSNLDGNFTLVGNQVMEFGSITVLHNMRVGAGKIIQDECCAGRIINIKGDLINEGTIRNGYGGLTTALEGNLINRGILQNNNLRFSGTQSQHITCNAPISSYNIWKDPDGEIIADNNLIIDSLSRVYLDNDILNMGTHKLTKFPSWNADYWFTGGVIKSQGEIDISGISVLRSNVEGNVVFTGKDRMECGTLNISGNITVAPGKLITDECCAGRILYLTGVLNNYGEIKNKYGGLGLQVTGDLYNYSDIAVNWLKISTNGVSRNIAGNMNSPLYLEQSGPQNGEIISADGLVSNKQIVNIAGYTTLKIPQGSSFLSSGELQNYGLIINQGTFMTRFRTWYNMEYDYSQTSFIKIKYLDKSADTTLLTNFNNIAHPLMTSSVKRWWRVQANGKINSYTAAVYYDESMLNGNDENFLELFGSPDSGKTWKRLSNPSNTTRDVNNNILFVGTDANPITEGIGDLILSSSRIVKVPSISTSISGRKQIRVGPPNRYTITYWNNDSEPTDKFFMILRTNQGVHIESVISKNILSGELVETPKDSLSFDSNHDEVLLLIQPLGAKEIRSFDVILTAELGALQKTALEPITFTAVALWIGGAILEEYVSNTIVEGCYEMWRPVNNDESLKDASIKAVKNSLNKAVTVENAGTGIAKKAAEEVIKKTGRVAVWPVMLAKDILDCLGNTVKGMKDYVNGNFDEKGKELQKVTSWDPNAKEGPAGYGAEGFMATAAPMSYTIFFENKKEAQAPAWKIVIVDTLDPNVYDLSSVQFGAMSHPMGVKTQNGNILQWEFVNIELPPNITPPEGEGWVKFTVKLKNNLSTGTKIANRAVIKFDLNPWLATNTFVNTLDFDKPVSSPKTVYRIPDKNEVELIWENNDGAGSGVKNSLVYMANNDGPFTLTATVQGNSVHVPVEPNIMYKFYVLSQDNVGNMEEEPKQILEIMTGVENKKDEIPREFELRQNYPNPFNPSTTFSFSLPEKGMVELIIYNVLGEEITRLMDQELSAGRYNIEWNASALSSGIYIYRFTYKEHQHIRKMMLLK